MGRRLNRGGVSILFMPKGRSNAMGKQTDAINLIRTTFEKYPQLHAVDLDPLEGNTERLKVTCVPNRKEMLPDGLSASLEEAIFKVYSGKKQITKLIEQRFTRDDFSRPPKDE
jgi:hypothetical protein